MWWSKNIHIQKRNSYVSLFVSVFLLCLKHFCLFFSLPFFFLSHGGKETKKGTKKAKEHTTKYLVDPASSHMLVTKAKPCMCKNKPKNGESANGSLKQLSFI